MMTQPDDAEVPQAPPSGSYPTSIKAAGIIWIGAGIIGLIQIAVLFASGQLARGGGTEGCGCCCLCGSTNLLFLAIGYETASWRIRWSTAVNGAVSGAVGVACAAQAVLVILTATNVRRISPLEIWLLGGVSVLMSIALVAAGVLAIAGWRHYSRSRAGRDRLSEMSSEQADFDELSADSPDDDED